MRSRSRSKQVRRASGSSCLARSPAPNDLVAPAASRSFSASSRAWRGTTVAVVRGRPSGPCATTVPPGNTVPAMVPAHVGGAG